MNHLQRKQRLSLVTRRMSFVIYLFARMESNLGAEGSVKPNKPLFIFILIIIEFELESDRTECNAICISNSIIYSNLFTSQSHKYS